jgi:hypothetical protein
MRRRTTFTSVKVIAVGLPKATAAGTPLAAVGALPNGDAVAPLNVSVCAPV